MIGELLQVAIQAACISTWSVLILHSIYVNTYSRHSIVGGPHRPGPAHLYCGPTINEQETGEYTYSRGQKFTST